jgi:pimeloyl-ACP methyl ester carboxylesterase
VRRAARRLAAGPAGRLLVGWLASATLVVLATPLGERGGAAEAGLRFLVEFLTEGTRPWLTAASRPPGREPLPLEGGGRADRWRPPGPGRRPAMVLVHGLTPDGKDDARLGWAAGLLAQAGLLVVVPDLPALRAQRLRPEDARVVRAALAAAAAEADRVAILAVSVGIQPALAAAVEPAVAGRVRVVVSLGGYAEARELVRHFTTTARLDPVLARGFLLSNLDLVQDPAERAAVQAALAGQPLSPSAGAEARAVLAVLENRDPGRVDTLLAALPAETRALLDALSPVRHVGRLRGRLVLVHGRDDPAIPFTESRRLAAAADPARARLVLVDLLAHVEGRAPAWQQARDFLRLWSVVYELFRG